MSTDIKAFISFDDNLPDDQPPFTYDPSYWDLRHDWRFSTGKHYEFFAAIAGMRNESGKPPLYPLRGLPKCNPSDSMKDHLDDLLDLCDEETIGWLTLSEIEASLDHMGISRDSLDESVLLVLDVMAVAVKRFGDERVRLIFGFS